MKAGDFFKHSTIYAVGQILTRLASVLLLPLYTHALTPEQYGLVAILDVGAVLLALLLADGVSHAVVRFHFDDEDPAQADRVWWTGLTYVVIVTAIVAGPLMLCREQLGVFACGDSIPASTAGWFAALTLISICFGTIQNLLNVYLRVQKRSVLFVVLSLIRLVAGIGLNVYFLLTLKMGPEGLLLSNAIVTAFNAVVLVGVFVWERGRFCFDFSLCGNLLRYGAPLILSGLAATMMHEGDRYLLRVFGSLEHVGVYSLAHKLGFAIHSLCLLPFVSVWQVAIFEIEKQEDSQKTFVRAFDWFTSGLGILFLGAALTIHPVLPWLTPNSYAEAAELVSVILLGFFLFGMNIHFDVPALLSKRTTLLIPGCIAGLAVNIVGNILLIPLIGAWGAAWTGVLTYAVFAFCNLWLSRRAGKIPYRGWHTAIKCVAFCATYAVTRWLCFPHLSQWGQLILSVVVCAVWAVVLLGRDAISWWVARQRTIKAEKATATPQEEPSLQRPALQSDVVEG